MVSLMDMQVCSMVAGSFWLHKPMILHMILFRPFERALLRP
jgi:hypothetical protein